MHLLSTFAFIFSILQSIPVHWETRLAEIENAPRIMDRLLRTDPGFTFKKKPGKVERWPFPVE
ncbi:MAG: hypothetical protein DF168_01015 [Candidatus Moanabacter tarae]|uniref:Uncharacterized protein n=1 Tax=Candidatus Moanibacter tarae TaxID=2200854 RepID=A0A2Z4ALI9_9BACT|nr:MAG: hypothetical protein DF168_01015 [Candidatus Moanabacter tarae]